MLKPIKLSVHCFDVSSRGFKRGARLFAGVVFLLWFFSTLSRAVYFDVYEGEVGAHADHFRNAVAAKNIAMGLGWSSTGYETYPLNPEILTTGPLVILPASLAVYGFGNELHVPALAVAGLNFILFFLIIATYKKISTSESTVYFFPGFLMIFFMTIYPYFWESLLGEVPTFLCLILSILLLTRAVNENRISWILVGGLVAGMSIMGKQLAAISCVGLTIGLFAHAYWIQNSTLMKSSARALVFLLAWLIPPGMFECYKQWVLSGMDETWVAGYWVYANRIFRQNSGLGYFLEYIHSPGDTLARLWAAIKGNMIVGSGFFEGGLLGVNTWKGWLLLYGLVTIIFIRKIVGNFPIFLSLMAAIPLLAWIVFFANGIMPRYFYLPVGLISLFFIFSVLKFTENNGNILPGVFLILLFIVSSSTPSKDATLTWRTSPSDREIKIYETLSYIKNSPTKLSWLGMRDGSEFEFLLEHENNFLCGIEQIGEALEIDSAAYLRLYPEVENLISEGKYSSVKDYLGEPFLESHIIPIQWKHDFQFDWLRIIQGAGKINYEKEKKCSRILYANPYYMIERCSKSDINRIITQQGGMSFRPPSWLKPRETRPEWSLLNF